jgi:hypothetical protein
VKVFGVYSEENRTLKDEWFLKTLSDDFELNFKLLGSNCGKEVGFSSDYWFSALRKRHEYVCQAIRDNFGEIILCVDLDIQFFGQCLPIIKETIAKKDIVFQSEHWPPTGEINAGFVAIRCNDKTLYFYTMIAKMEFEKMPLGDQSAINRLLREKSNNIKWGVFPSRIWARSHGCAPPDDVVVHHANCTANTASKVKQLKLIRRMVLAKPGSIFWIYKKFYNFKNINIRNM